MDSDSKHQKSGLSVSVGISRFPERLRIAMEGRSIRGFARECGLSEGVLRSYLRGDTFPSLDRLGVLAVAAGVSDTWLATGEGPMRRGGEHEIQESPESYRLMDERLLGEVIEEVERCLQECGLDLPPAKKKELILTVYNLSSPEGKVDRATVGRLIKLAS